MAVIGRTLNANQTRILVAWAAALSIAVAVAAVILHQAVPPQKIQAHTQMDWSEILKKVRTYNQGQSWSEVETLVLPVLPALRMELGSPVGYEIFHLYADALRQMHRAETAAAMYSEVVALNQEHRLQSDPDTLSSCYLSLALCNLDLNKREEAQRDFLTAQRFAEQINSIWLGHCYYWNGVLAYRTHHFNYSELLAAKALTQFHKYRNFTAVVFAHLLASDCYSQMGRLDASGVELNVARSVMVAQAVGDKNIQSMIQAKYAALFRKIQLQGACQQQVLQSEPDRNVQSPIHR